MFSVVRCTWAGKLQNAPAPPQKQKRLLFWRGRMWHPLAAADLTALQSCQWSSPVRATGRESPQTVRAVSPVKTAAPHSAGSTLRAAPPHGLKKTTTKKQDTARLKLHRRPGFLRGGTWLMWVQTSRPPRTWRTGSLAKVLWGKKTSTRSRTTNS